MARIGHKLNEDGGKNISQGGSSFSQLGDDGDIGMQGARKLESEQVIVVQMRHPHGFGAYGTRGAPNTVFGPDRGAGNFKRHRTSLGQWTPDYDQGSAS